MCCAHKRGRLFFCGCFTMPRRMPHAGWGFTGGACTGRNHPGDRNGNGGVDMADIMTICREFPRQGIFDKGQAVCGAIRFLRTKMHLPAYIGIRDPPKRAKNLHTLSAQGAGEGLRVLRQGSRGGNVRISGEREGERYYAQMPPERVRNLGGGLCRRPAGRLLLPYADHGGHPGGSRFGAGHSIPAELSAAGTAGIRPVYLGGFVNEDRGCQESKNVPGIAADAVWH